MYLNLYPRQNNFQNKSTTVDKVFPTWVIEGSPRHLLKFVPVDSPDQRFIAPI